MTQQSLEQGKCLDKKLEKSPLEIQQKCSSVEDSNSCFGNQMSTAVEVGDLNLCWSFPDVCESQELGLHLFTCALMWIPKAMWGWIH